MDTAGRFDFTHTKLSFGRPWWSYAKVQALLGALARGRRFQFRYLGRDAEYVNVGCGPFAAPGFCNLDYEWRPEVLCWDVTRGLPLAEASARGIFTEHCLEHLSRDQCRFVLRQFTRVLRPGGVARVIVPDGELYCRLCVQALDGHAVNWPYPDAGRTPLEQVNRVMRDHGHQFIYDYQTLRASMLEAGFREVRRQSYGRGQDPKLLLDQESRARESLYVEGIV